jgi:hypothetical protein
MLPFFRFGLLPWIYENRGVWIQSGVNQVIKRTITYYIFRQLVEPKLKELAVLEQKSLTVTDAQEATRVLKKINQIATTLKRADRVINGITVATNIAQILILSQTKLGPNFRLHNAVIKLLKYIVQKLVNRTNNIELGDYTKMYEIMAQKDSQSRRLLMELAKRENRSLIDFLAKLQEGKITNPIEVEQLISEALEINRNTPIDQLVEGVLHASLFYLKRLYNNLLPLLQGPTLAELATEVHKYQSATDGVLEKVAQYMAASDSINKEFTDLPIFLINLRPGTGNASKMLPNTFEALRKMYELAYSSNVGIRIFVALYLMDKNNGNP